MHLDDATLYWIARGQTVFGPYSGTLVRQYFESGHIILTDQIRGERDAEWMPMSFAMGLPPTPPLTAFPPSIGGGSVQSGATDPAMMLAAWSLGLGVVSILCCGVVTAIPGGIVGWMAFSKPRGPARSWAIAGLVTNIVGLIFGIISILAIPAFLSALKL